MNDNSNFILIAPSNKAAYELIQNLVPLLEYASYTAYVISPNEDSADRLLELGVKVIGVPQCKNSYNLFTAARYILTLRRVLRRLNPDSVLGYTTNPAAYGAIAARICGVRSISLLIDKMDHIPFFHKLGYLSAHNIIFDDYNNRYVSELFDLVKRDTAWVINGCGLKSEKRWTTDYCEQLYDAMNLYV
ncbi:MAG: glycosyltransferase [Rikenellaceae bacterium]